MKHEMIEHRSKYIECLLFIHIWQILCAKDMSRGFLGVHRRSLIVVYEPVDQLIAPVHSRFYKESRGAKSEL